VGNEGLVVLQNQPPLGAELAQDLIVLRHQIDKMELLFSRLAARFAATDHWEEEGSVSAIDWIRHQCHMNEGPAADRVAVGRRMWELQASAQAMSEGEIGFSHLTTLVRTAEASGERFDESKLLKAARESSPGKFFHVCRHYRHSVDKERYAKEQANEAEGRSFRMSQTQEGGYVVGGWLDSIGGAALRNALEPLAQKSGEHDDRELDQRLGDALVELATLQTQTNLNVTSSLETLLGLCGAPAAEMDFSLPVSSTTVERLACDSGLTRILLGSESQVIDVGRSRRSSRARPARRWRLETGTASGRAATGRPSGAPPTTWCTGSRVGPPTWTT
jgi:hypothetical protein